ncbi:hypothetical protein ACFSKW_03435 [Nonomuraea mangrovi]|uniref:Tetratricopeptide repeat protein n=1 Tax=Nonomuraea mangrovi TaxID=2316207 RepID=A0ABW4SNE4_9ACTN
MTGRRRHWLGQAALAYEAAGRLHDAARCRQEAGEPLPAAELYERAGELEVAAACYLRAGSVAEAARCHLAMGRPEAAADCWERVGRPLEAAWILIVAARKPERGGWVLRAHVPGTLGQRLRHDVALAMCAALPGEGGGDTGPLAAALAAVERDLDQVRPAAERLLVERWAVEAATEVARYDLAALVFAAAHRSGLRGAAGRWRAWAERALGGTSGIPVETEERRAG